MITPKLVLQVHSLELIRRAAQRASAPAGEESQVPEEAPGAESARAYKLNRRSKASQEQAA